MRALLSFLVLSLTVVSCFGQNLVYGGNVSIGGNSGGSIAVSGCSGGNNWVQDQAAVTASSSGTAVSTSFSPTSGSFVAIWIFYRNDSSQPVTSVTDNATGGSSTYSFATNVVGYFTHYTLSIAYCYNVKAGVTSITVNVPTTGQVTTVVKSWTGQCTVSDPLDKVSNCVTNTGTTITGGSITTSAGSELVLGYAATLSSASSFTATGGFTLTGTGHDLSNGDSVAGEEILNAASGSYSASFTVGSIGWASFTASFKGR